MERMILLRNLHHLPLYLLLASILMHYVSWVRWGGVLSAVIVFDFGKDVEPYVYD